VWKSFGYLLKQDWQRNKQLFKRLGLIIFILGLFSPAYGQKKYFATLDVSRIVPISMGGAYVAVEDGIGSVAYNPASVKFWNLKRGFRFSLIANPVASTGLFLYYKDNQTTPLNDHQWWNVARTLLKGVVFSIPSFQAGITLYEEPLQRYKELSGKNVFSAKRFLSNHYETAFMRINLADRFSLGGTLSYYTFEDSGSVRRELGASYGVLIKPARNLNVGIMFYDVPDVIQNIRLPLERIVDETVNVGLSYTPFRGTMASLDVRNISEETKPASREVHFGMEQKFGKVVGLRGGYFQENKTHKKYFSAGIGLLSTNLFRPDNAKYDNADYVFNYSYVIERSDLKWKDQWHLFSFLFYF